MARIRTIKPEFPQSESVGRLSREARLLFIQLWTVVDDYGRARAAPRLLAGQLYPYDTDAIKLIGGWLEELEANDFVRLYQSEGSQYLDIPAWSKHQRIDNAGKSTIPECPPNFAETRREPPRTAANLGDSPLDLGPRKGKDLGPSTGAVACATRSAAKDEFEEFWESYPKRGTAANPKKPAREKFEKLVKGGESPAEITAGARRYRDLERAAGRENTEKIAQAITWLNQERWRDYLEAPAARADTEPIWNKPPPGQPSLEEIRAKYGVSYAEGNGPQVRGDPRVGQNGADHSQELRITGGSPLRDENGRAAGPAPDD